MPSKLVVQDPTVNSAANVAALRAKWQGAKAKHAAALTAKKIAFSKGLGGMLDKRIGYYKTARAFKVGHSIVLARSNLNALKANGKTILATAKAYQGKIKGLGDPAEDELDDLLRIIARDAGQYDIDWVENKYTSSAIADEKKKAAEALAKAKAKAAKK